MPLPPGCGAVRHSTTWPHAHRTNTRGPCRGMPCMGASRPRKSESEGVDPHSGLYKVGCRCAGRERIGHLSSVELPRGVPEEKAFPLSQTSAAPSRCAAWGIRERPMIIGALHDGAEPPCPHRPRKAGFFLLRGPLIFIVSPHYAHTGCRPSIILGIDTLRPKLSQRGATASGGQYWLSACEGRPRCVGSVQRGGSTCNDSHARTDQPWAMMLAVAGGVPRPAWARRAGGGQKC